MSVGKAEGCGREVHTVTVIKDDRGYGMTVSGNDPVQVQSVVRGGAAWRAGVRKGDLILVVNGNAVESEGHAHVVELIKASPTVVLKLHRNSTITAPLPVCREKQLQVDHNKVLTIHLMLESEIRFIESLRNALAKNPSDRKQAELEAAEMRRAKLQQQLYMQTSPTSSHPNEALLHGPPQPTTETPPRHGFLSNLPRSLSSLTGQSLRGIRANNNNNNHAQASPVTCLDGSAGSATLPPPLPPRSTGPPVPPPPPPPISSSAATTANHHNSHNHRHHHTAPNSIAVQMAYPLVTGTPPLIQNAAPGHHRSESSPEELNEINNANDEGEWELVGSPPGTPPPPYPSSPAPPVILDTQRAIISMEEDDMSPTLPRNSFSSGGFACVDTLSIARLAVFLNWVAGERRPAQAVLLYLLSDAYSKGPSTVLPRWAYELHSAFLVPEAPLSLKNVDENLAREIDDALIKDHDKEDVLRKIFLKAREKAKEEMTQQLHEFQVKRQLGLGAFYGPSDSVLNQCDLDKTQELDVIMKYLIPNLNTWIDHSSMDPWGATKGSPSNSLLAAAVPALLQYTFCLKPQLVNSAIIGSPPGSPPRPAFLQRDKLFKQRMKHLNKSSSHPLMIRGHHLSPMTVTSVCHCHHCHFVIWGIAPQAYNCSDCKLRVHRSCARSVEEPCCGPTAPPTRISRLMEKLGSVPTSQTPLGNSHQHIDSNQHHHLHEKKQKKSSASSHFLNIDRGTRKGDEDSQSVLDTSVTSHNTSGDNKRDDDTGTESVSQLTDSSHFSSEHSAERADSACQSRSGIAIRPVTRAESYRDRADRVKRTKRKTSDPNQLTSNREYHDVEVLGAVGGSAVPSGGSSNSSLSSKSNESAQADHGSGSEWSDEDDSSAPWSSRAPPELLANMSNLARKRQDLIHELICSEWSHVRWLRVLRRVYLIPLQKAGSTLLTPQELRALLPNLPDVLTRHKALAKELRTLQQSPKVFTGPVADALISMLGESKYAATLSRFCGGQGLALDALKEKRKRNKDLNAFLAKCEQDPMCARLRLQDFLACVWQRLTKYQLLLEGIHKSSGVIEEEVDNNPDGTQCEDFNKISVALDMAKDVLNRVNTAIQTTENEHRLRTIQGKLEFRLGEMPDGGVELKRLDLAKHSLVMEGTLSIRQDSSKKVNVLALLMRECLVLLHTDGDRYILKPIAQSAHQPLSPVIYWDKVIYRNNAAVKNGFFLVNFDGVLYEFSALSTVEYNTWAKHLMEYGRGLSGGVKNVISDEASAAMIPSTPPTKLSSPDSVPNGTPEPEPVTTNEPKPESKPVENPDDGNKVNGAAVSLVSEDEAGISGMEPKMDSSLVDPGVLTINEPPSTMLATIELTPEEKIRRAEKKISTAMIAVSEATKDISGNKPLLKTALNTLVSQDMEKLYTDSTQSLLLQAQDHVNKLTEVLLKALRVPITECSSTKCRISFSDGLCDTCSARYAMFLGNSESVVRNHKVERQRSWKGDKKESENNMESIVLLEEVGESSTDPTTESEIEVVDSSGAGLRSILSELMIRLSNEEAERSVLRAKLQKADERIHYLHQLHKDCQHSGEEPTRSGHAEGNPSSSNDTSSGPG